MYKIFRSMITDAGPNTEALLDSAIENLSTQVNEAEVEGWVVSGGPQVLSRQKPHGLLVWVMQAMVKEAAQASKSELPVEPKQAAGPRPAPKGTKQ